MSLNLCSSQMINQWNRSGKTASCNYRINWLTIKSFDWVDCPVNQGESSCTFSSVRVNGITFPFSMSRAHLQSLSAIRNYNVLSRAQQQNRLQFLLLLLKIMLIRYLASAEVKGRPQQTSSISPHNWEKLGFNCIINLVKLSCTEV